MGAVIVGAILLVGNAALWHVLLPLWLALFITLHLAMQHLATRMDERAPDRRHPLLQLLAQTKPAGPAGAAAANDTPHQNEDQR